MIQLDRKKDDKWIFQKNISSKELIEAYVKVINDTKDMDKMVIKEKLKNDNFYKGRSNSGSINTMGVRFSQMCFYMFGYKNNNTSFIPSQTTLNIINNTSVMNKNMLVNLFSIQFPHPYSKTPSSFNIYAGRLIIKLLTDSRIGKRIYIDEFIWFLPFIKNIDEAKYEELISSVLEYRELSYYEKQELFSSVENYTDIFSNCMHEINYYFARIFQEFGVISLVPDIKHNDGKLFKFKHGTTETYRTDRILTKAKCSGYMRLDDSLLDSAEMLVRKFSPFQKPTTLSDSLVFSKEEWIIDLYENELINYLATILPNYDKQREIINSITSMQYMSKYSSVDGKDFEKSLKPVFELFREAVNVEIISGSGDTDLLCAIGDSSNGTGINSIYKINIEGKSRKSSSNMNPMRLVRHLEIHSSRYCIVVAPRFSKGTLLDISTLRIVTITADSLAKYCSKECFHNADSLADFSSIDKIIVSNLGKDISSMVDKLTNQRYGITI